MTGATGPGEPLWSDGDRRPASGDDEPRRGEAGEDVARGEAGQGGPERPGARPGARPAYPDAASLPGSGPPRFSPPRHLSGFPEATVAARGPELVLAGWWRRALAATIDTLIIALVAVGVLVVLGIGFFSADSEAEAVAVGALSLVALAVFVVVTLVYAPVMLWLTNGKTLGRMAAGTRVVRANGSPMTLMVATIREVVLKAVVFGLLSQATFGLAGLIDVLWPLIDRENRALHDFGVDTRTVLG